MRGTARVVLVNMAAIVAIFTLAEVACRMFGIPYDGRWVPSESMLGRFDADQGWSYTPNRSWLLDFGDRRDIPYDFDASGIRVPSPDHVFRARQPAILFVGCSITFGQGLRYEETFAAQTGTLLGGGIQAVNLGVQAYGTDQSLLALKRHAPRFDARAVVYTFLENRDDGHHVRNNNYDRRQLFPHARFIGTKPLFRVGADGRPALARRPVLFERFSPGTPAGGTRHPGLFHWDYPHSWLADAIGLAWRRLSGAPPRGDVRLTRALLLEMQRYCRERGIDFVVVRWRYEDDPEMDGLFAGLDVPVIDTLRDAPPDWEQMLIPGDGHPDERAAQRAAILISDYLVRYTR